MVVGLELDAGGQFFAEWGVEEPAHLVEGHGCSGVLFALGIVFIVMVIEHAVDFAGEGGGVIEHVAEGRSNVTANICMRGHTLPTLVTVS